MEESLICEVLLLFSLSTLSSRLERLVRSMLKLLLNRVIDCILLFWYFFSALNLSFSRISFSISFSCLIVSSFNSSAFVIRLSFYTFLNYNKFTISTFLFLFRTSGAAWPSLAPDSFRHAILALFLGSIFLAIDSAAPIARTLGES